MPKASKKKLSPVWFVLIIFLALVDLVMIIRWLVHGKNMALFNPKGLIAHEQRSLMVFVVSVLLTIAVPTLSLLFFIAWKYRESNGKAVRALDGRHSKLLPVVMWLIPLTFLCVLASVMWPATHKLQPRKSIDSAVQPLTIQVISMRWKWLFLYPEQDIATVNFVEIPVNTPVQFELTADDAPMSSFWIPNLGGQLYSMTAHVNQLNLMADTLGDYRGRSAEINGSGFAGMQFTAHASSKVDFDNWVQRVRQSPDVLGSNDYANLVKPSENNPVTFYAAYTPYLYANVISKYEGPGGHTH